jgi:hypothetical protein
VFKDMDQWVEIRRRVLTKELSKRGACKEYDLEWRTLQRILKHEEPAGYQMTEPRQKRKLAAFLPIIHEILEQDRQAPKKQASYGAAHLRSAASGAPVRRRRDDR